MCCICKWSCIISWGLYLVEFLSTLFVICGEKLWLLHCLLGSSVKHSSQLGHKYHECHGSLAVCSTVCTGSQHRKPQSLPLLTLVIREIIGGFPSQKASNGECISWSWHHHNNHYIDVIISMIVSQITSLTIVHSTVYSGADQRKHQSSMSLAFVRGIHWGPVNSSHKGPVTWKMFPFDYVIMIESTW